MPIAQYGYRAQPRECHHHGCELEWDDDNECLFCPACREELGTEQEDDYSDCDEVRTTTQAERDDYHGLDTHHDVAEYRMGE